MRSWFATFVIVLLDLLVGASFLYAAPKVSEIDQHYEIRGSSARQLRAQMSVLGTKWSDGKVYDARTDWHVRWNHGYRRSKSGCSIASVRTTVSVTYTYPKWVDRLSGPAHLRAKWDNYMAALTQHERGHRDIAVDAAERIEQAIASLGPMKSCDELGKAANTLGHRIVDEYKRKEVDYDRETAHGRSQGAVFP